jgi:pilus assembly protein CpaF
VLHKQALAFSDDQHLLRIVQRVLALGRRLDESSPMVDARLPGGGRLNAVIPPLALDGPLVSIRKFRQEAWGMDDLVRMGSLDAAMSSLLHHAVRERCNILISGGTSSGKTSLLNAMAVFIPESERVVTIEDAAELSLHHPHVVRMESRPAGLDGQGTVSTRDLLRNSLRMRPDRIIVGEVRGAEVLEMLQAMNTGHDGSMATIHASSPRECLYRLEMLAGFAGFAGSELSLRRQMVSALDFIVQIGRLPNGKRRLLSITEVVGMVDDTALQELYRHESQGGQVDSWHSLGVPPQTPKLAAWKAGNAARGMADGGGGRCERLGHSECGLPAGRAGRGIVGAMKRTSACSSRWPGTCRPCWSSAKGRRCCWARWAVRRWRQGCPGATLAAACGQLALAVGRLVGAGGVGAAAGGAGLGARGVAALVPADGRGPAAGLAALAAAAPAGSSSSPAFIDGMVRMVVLGHATVGLFAGLGIGQAAFAGHLEPGCGFAAPACRWTRPWPPPAAIGGWKPSRCWRPSCRSAAGSAGGSTACWSGWRISARPAAGPAGTVRPVGRGAPVCLGAEPAASAGGGAIIITNADYFMQLWNDTGGRQLLACGRRSAGGRGVHAVPPGPAGMRRAHGPLSAWGRKCAGSAGVVAAAGARVVAVAAGPAAGAAAPPCGRGAAAAPAGGAHTPQPHSLRPRQWLQRQSQRLRAWLASPAGQQVVAQEDRPCWRNAALATAWVWSTWCWHAWP